MKELEKNLEATGGVPAEAELAAINRFAKSPLRAEEVYTFSLRLCDNEVDRDWERFDTAALNTLGDLFVGKSGIFDHQWTAEGQTARIYRTEMVREGAQVTAAGDGYCWLKAWAYLLRTEKNADLIAEIEGGIKKEVSVGCSMGRSVCSVCGAENGACSHVKGPGGCAPSVAQRAAPASTRRGSGTGSSCATWSCGIPPTHTSGPSWRCQPSGRRGS